ncbi:MAG: MarR family transcriptional regulator [Thermoplasmatales archaeon]
MVQIAKNKINRSILTIIFLAILSVSSVILLFLFSFILFLLHYTSVLNSFVGTPFTLFVYIGIGITGTLLVFSILSMFSRIGVLDTVNAGSSGEGENEVTESMNFLDKEEKELIEMLVKAGGSMLQRDIARSGDYSKAKVTRILNRLESKGLIVRLRHGSTNKVVLKRYSKSQ